MITLYIDPGAGSMVIQAVLAAALAVPFLFRSAVGRAIARVRGKRSDGPAAHVDGGAPGD